MRKSFQIKITDLLDLNAKWIFSLCTTFSFFELSHECATIINLCEVTETFWKSRFQAVYSAHQKREVQTPVGTIRIIWYYCSSSIKIIWYPAHSLNRHVHTILLCVSSFQPNILFFLFVSFSVFSRKIYVCIQTQSRSSRKLKKRWYHWVLSRRIQAVWFSSNRRFWSKQVESCTKYFRLNVFPHLYRFIQ